MGQSFSGPGRYAGDEQDQESRGNPLETEIEPLPVEVRCRGTCMGVGRRTCSQVVIASLILSNIQDECHFNEKMISGKTQILLNGYLNGLTHHFSDKTLQSIKPTAGYNRFQP
jgi:hypothetical protein